MSHEDLQERAERVLTSLQKRACQRPVFIEFAGTPKSGKSTCIDIVHHFFRRVGFKVLAPAEGASKRTPYYLRNNLMAFNTWSASYALMHVLEGLYGSDRYDLAILDRGLFDALAWFQLLAARTDDSRITEDERDQVQEFLQITHWRSAIDVVLLFTADPETSLEREQSNKLIGEHGNAMNPEFLADLNSAYGEVKTSYADHFARFAEINTSSTEEASPESTAAQVAGIILEEFESGLESGAAQ